MPGLSSEHPLRRELHAELHARPSLYFDGDNDVWHVALAPVDGRPAVPVALTTLEGVKTKQNGRHGSAAFCGGQLKWELHTEFLTVTFAHKVEAEESRPPSAFLALCDAEAGHLVAAVRVSVRGRGSEHDLGAPSSDYVASTVGGGDAEVRSNFRLDPHGFVQILLINEALNAYRVGRMVRRLLEIETYRMMALLAAPVARETSEALARHDRRLHHLVTHMQSAVKVDKDLLSEVTRLTSDVLELAARAQHRFGASKAYAEIVASRILELREGRVEQRQRIGTFVERRFQPAVRSFLATERRLRELVDRTGIAGALLTTTVQVQLEDQNASLLASMEERTAAQLHIQQAVEGLSVIAITYYGVGLLKTVLENLSEFGVEPRLERAMLLVFAPLILIAVWWNVRRIRRRSPGMHTSPQPPSRAGRPTGRS